jgi:hypothetical protein
MAVEPVNVRPGLNFTISVGGTALPVLPAGLNGGIVQNPQSKEDEGIATAEPIYIDPISAPTATAGSGWGTTFTIYPGQMWVAIPGQITQTFMNAQTSGHRVSAISW